MKKLRSATTIVLLSASSIAGAQSYPTKPIQFIVPFPPGGGNDTVARAIAQQAGPALGQSIVVDNRPGAGGIIGADAAARAAPDGYTIFLGGVATHAVNPHLHPRLSYDPIKDFAPITLVASAPSVLVVHPSVPAQTIKEFAAYARANPGKLNYASNGNGSSSHMAAVLYETNAGVKMTHVPYKGVGPALTDLMTGRIEVMFNSIVAILPHIQSGKLRALGVTSKQRSALLPDVPTIAESGWPAYEAGSWYGILAPAGTPSAIIDRLQREIVKSLKDPEVQKRLAGEGADVIGSTPQEFAAHIKAELARMGQAIKAAGLKLE
jgi:tripartite-type tricarboxylate transporter receptor subunit TctC